MSRDKEVAVGIVIPAFNDMHVHLRDLEVAGSFAGISAIWCENVLAMPNLRHPLDNWSDIAEYRFAISKPGMQSLVAFYLYQSHSPEFISEMFHRGCYIAKAYPRGKTTNSSDGILDYRQLYPVFDRMQSLGMTLCVHGEHPIAGNVLTREQHFLVSVLQPIRESFPKLRIVLEHISTKEAVTFVYNQPDNKTAATITPHHLMLTIDDVIGDKLEPRNFCKPVVKSEEDRQSLVSAAIGNDDRFFLGSDSAPHQDSKKYCDGGCAGVFTSQFLPQLLATVFDKYDAIDKLADFSSNRARLFYGLPRSTRNIAISKLPATIPQNILISNGWYSPFMGGKAIGWSAYQL